MIHFFEKPSSLSRVHSFALVFMELFKTFFLIIYWFSLNMSHVGLKKKVTRSDLFKPCSPSTDLIFALNWINFHKNICLNDILVTFEFESCRVKN